MSKLGMRTTIGLGLIAAAIVVQAAVPRGAFIRRPVKSVPDLVAHAKTDPIVMDRLTRHFRLSSTNMISYLQSLHMAKLAQDGVYLVYNVHADNVIRGKYFKLKKGTLVFADSSGRPILKKECGNAMTMSLPSIVAESPTTKPIGERAVLGDVNSSEELTPYEPSVGAVPPPPAPPVAPPVRTAVQGGFIAGGGPAGLAFLPLLLAVGGGTSLLIKKEDNDTPPVPEPITLVILGTGAAAVALRRKKS